jgi:hypothetical protein
MKTLSFLICCLIPNIALSSGLDFPAPLAYISEFQRAGGWRNTEIRNSSFNSKFFETVFGIVVRLLHIFVI